MVSAKPGEHVRSSTLSAHQVARASEPVNSDGSIVWVRMHDGDTDQSYYRNRRTRETTWRAVEVVWVGETSAGSCGTGTRSLVSLHITASLGWFLGDGLRGEGLGIPSPLLGCHSS